MKADPQFMMLLHAFANVVTDNNGEVEQPDHPDFLTAAHALLSNREQYAREFAAAQLKLMRDWFLNIEAANLVSRSWVAEKLEARAEELLK